MGAEAKTSAVERLADSVLTFLRRYPPFDKLEPDALEFMAVRLALGYYPKDTAVIAPDRGTPAFFYIIQRGLVQISPGESNVGTAREVIALGPGECFSVGALLEKRPVTSPYVAAADTFCYQLTAEDFSTLIHRSTRATTRWPTRWPRRNCCSRCSPRRIVTGLSPGRTWPGCRRTNVGSPPPGESFDIGQIRRRCSR